MTNAALIPTYHELNLGVDPDVAADLGYPVPEQYLSEPKEDTNILVAGTAAEEEPVVPFVPVEHRPYRENLVTSEQALIGKTAIAALRQNTNQ